MDLRGSRPGVSRIGAWHEIRCYHSGPIHAELGHKNVGALQIGLTSMPPPDRADPPAPSNPPVEYNREDAARVKPRKTTPIDRPVIANESYGPRVTDNTVSPDLLILCLNRNPETCQKSSTLSSTPHWANHDLRFH